MDCTPVWKHSYQCRTDLDDRALAPWAIRIVRMMTANWIPRATQNLMSSLWFFLAFTMSMGTNEEVTRMKQSYFEIFRKSIDPAQFSTGQLKVTLRTCIETHVGHRKSTNRENVNNTLVSMCAGQHVHRNKEKPTMEPVTNFVGATSYRPMTHSLVSHFASSHSLFQSADRSFAENIPRDTTETTSC